MLEQVRISQPGKSRTQALNQFNDVIQRVTGRPLTALTVDQDFTATAELAPLGQINILRVISRRHEASYPGVALRSNGCFWTAVFQVSGRTRIEQQGNPHLLLPGHWSLNHRAAPFRVRHLEESEQIILAIPKRLLPHDAVVTGQAMSGARTAASGAARAIKVFADDMLANLTEVSEMGRAALGHALIDMLRAALADQATGAAAVASSELLRRRVLAYLEEHFADADITAERVAAALGCSRRYVHKAFHDAGDTLFHTVMSMRLERAREDMRNPLLKNCSISSIAYSVGFNDPAHFSRVFRKRFGMSPGDFRSAGDEPPPISLLS